MFPQISDSFHGAFRGSYGVELFGEKMEHESDQVQMPSFSIELMSIFNNSHSPFSPFAPPSAIVLSNQSTREGCKRFPIPRNKKYWKKFAIKTNNRLGRHRWEVLVPPYV
jgi:hypothetical protein